MSALHAKTAGLLLDSIPEQERIAVIRTVTRSLDAQSSDADIGLAAGLWKLYPERETRIGLVSHLRQLIEQDGSDRVATICKDHSELEHELLLNAIPRIASAAALLQNKARSSLAVAVRGSHQSSVLDRFTEAQEETASIIAQTSQLLGFINRIIHRSIEISQATSLLQSCLVLVGAVDKKLSQIAREALFSLFASTRTLDSTQQEGIWRRIESLTTAEDSYYKSLGFSLWLRWLSDQSIEPSILRNPRYWDLIVDGLRKGDSERRKSTLQILRASINASLPDPVLTSMIIADSQTLPLSEYHPTKR